jgi:hypothetical protein
MKRQARALGYGGKGTKNRAPKAGILWHIFKDTELPMAFSAYTNKGGWVKWNLGAGCGHRSKKSCPFLPY